MGGFGALTSFTGGGDLASSSSSSAGSGDSSTGAFNVGGLNFGTKQNNTGLYIAAAVVFAALILKK